MRKLIKTKLKGSAGESLAEVLIALLIAALALTMLASVISTSARIITQSKAKMKEYYDQENVLESQAVGSDTPIMEYVIRPAAVVEGEITEQSGEISLRPGDPKVYYFVNDKAGSTTVYSYKLQ